MDANDEVRTFDFDAGSVSVHSSPAIDKTSENEDRYAVKQCPDGSVILAVADGAGGHPNGDRAAQIAVESISQEIDNSHASCRVAIINGFEAAQRRIREQFAGAATTLIVAEIQNGTMRTYHAGDSGACIIGGRGKIKSQTIAHSPTGYALEAGFISEHEAMHHAERHLVSNMVGDVDMTVEISSTSFMAPRDTILLASDGLFDNMFIDELSAIACRGNIAQACQKIVDITKARMRGEDAELPGKPDDLTVILYRPGR
ncbi:MAG: PP2C family protein-serine/threonine phosphatase [Gammaproteobacteria bacterium]